MSVTFYGPASPLLSVIRQAFGTRISGDRLWCLSFAHIGNYHRPVKETIRGDDAKLDTTRHLPSCWLTSSLVVCRKVDAPQDDLTWLSSGQNDVDKVINTKKALVRHIASAVTENPVITVARFYCPLPVWTNCHLIFVTLTICFLFSAFVLLFTLSLDCCACHETDQVQSWMRSVASLRVYSKT